MDYKKVYGKITIILLIISILISTIAIGFAVGAFSSINNNEEIVEEPIPGGVGIEILSVEETKNDNYIETVNFDYEFSKNNGEYSWILGFMFEFIDTGEWSTGDAVYWVSIDIVYKPNFKIIDSIHVETEIRWSTWERSDLEFPTLTTSTVKYLDYVDYWEMNIWVNYESDLIYTSIIDFK